eukprot:429566-Pelagomonas_calceolata.AAC.2
MDRKGALARTEVAWSSRQGACHPSSCVSHGVARNHHRCPGWPGRSGCTRHGLLSTEESRVCVCRFCAQGLKAELLQRLKEAMAASQPSQGEAGSAAPAAEQQQDAPPPQAAGDQQQQKEEQPQSEQPQQKEEQPQPEQPQQEEQQPQQEQMDTDAVKDQGAAAPAGAGEGEQGQQQQGGGAEEPQQAPAEPAAGGEGAKEEGLAICGLMLEREACMDGWVQSSQGNISS